MIIRADGIQDELGKSTDDGVKFRVAVQFYEVISTLGLVKISTVKV